MQTMLFQMICRVGIFMICAQAMIHFRPKGSYEKYLKLLVSVMLLIQIFQPISKFFSGTTGADLQSRVEWYEQALQEGMHEAATQNSAAERLLEQMTMEELNRRIQEAGSREEEGWGTPAPEEGNVGTSAPKEENLGTPVPEEGSFGTLGQEEGNPGTAVQRMEGLPGEEIREQEDTKEQEIPREEISTEITPVERVQITIGQ